MPRSSPDGKARKVWTADETEGRFTIQEARPVKPWSASR